MTDYFSACTATWHLHT